MKTAPSSSEKYQLVAEINMIPFIDIALVLLIIFMIMTPFLVKEQIKIDLPRTKSSSTPVDEHRLLQVEVAKNGAIYVDGTSVPDDGVYEAIRGRLTDPENQPVVIAADRDVAFEHVVVVMDAAKRCGAKKLGVSVKQEGGASKASGEGGSSAAPADSKSKATHGSATSDTKRRSAPAASADSKRGGDSKNKAATKRSGAAAGK